MIEKKESTDLDIMPVHIPRTRPPVTGGWRKILFFVFREGFIRTIRKILSKMRFSGRYEASVVAAKIDGSFDAISYNGGQHFYVSSVERTDTPWKNPFSYDVLGQENKGEVAVSNGQNRLFLFGCGDYSRTYALKMFPRNKSLCCVDYSDLILADLAGRFRYRYNRFGDSLDVWRSSQSPVALVCTYHSDHAEQALRLFEANPEGYIFVEKPPAVTEGDIGKLIALYEQGARLEIGFNRRFAPYAKKIKEMLSDKPKIISITVNEVSINESHWYYWENQGTRITGNACHWIDLCQWLVGGIPKGISIMQSEVGGDDVVISITYFDGSLATIVLSDKGNGVRGVQEYIEVRHDMVTVWIEDFVQMTVIEPSGAKRVAKSIWRDKGHAAMYSSFRRNMVEGNYRTQYPLRDLVLVSLVTIQASQMSMKRETYYEFDWSRNAFKDYILPGSVS